MADLLREERESEPLLVPSQAMMSAPSVQATYGGVPHHRRASDSMRAYSRSSELAYNRRRHSDNTRTQGRTGSQGYYQSMPMGRTYAGYPGAMTPPVKKNEEDADLMLEVGVLKQELLEPPAVAIQKNFEIFECKLIMQQKELVDAMQRTVVREGDRVINTVLAGPHERIIDPVSDPFPIAA